MAFDDGEMTWGQMQEALGLHGGASWAMGDLANNAMRNNGQMPVDPARRKRLDATAKRDNLKVVNQPPQRAPEGPFATNPYWEAPMGNVGAAQYQFAQDADEAAGHLQRMINQTTNAWQDENDSRVAQSREQARMDHEVRLQAMQNDADLKAEAMRRDALLARLDAGTPKAFRVWDPKALNWRYTDQIRFG